MNSQHVLWIDGVGGFAMCDRSTTTIGGNSTSEDVQLRIASDLPRRAAILHHRGQDHLIEPIHNVWLSENKIASTSLLVHGDLIRLGTGVELTFAQPTQLSGTALLTLRSRHRWLGSIDGVLLLGQSCLIGPSPTAHVRCQNWEKDIVLFRNGNQWMVRGNEYVAEGSLGASATRPLKRGERFQGPDFSMTWL